MEPDHPEQVHGPHRYEPTEVMPVRTEPTPEHSVPKGKKSKPADEHYDVGAEQHYTHEMHEMEAHHEMPLEGYNPYSQHGYAPHEPRYAYDQYSDEYARHADPYAEEYHQPQHYPVYHQGGEPQGAHVDPYMPHRQEDMYAPHHSSQEQTGEFHFEGTHYQEDPYHYNPYSHPQPPRTKAEAEKHMGPEAALFYKEMHNKKQQQKPQ